MIKLAGSWRQRCGYVEKDAESREAIVLVEGWQYSRGYKPPIYYPSEFALVNVMDIAGYHHVNTTLPPEALRRHRDPLHVQKPGISACWLSYKLNLDPGLTAVIET